MKMNDVYRSIGTTKQNVHQRLNRHLRRQEEKASLEYILRQAREDHPGMGADMMYRLLQLEFVGRDRFRCLYRELGFTIEQKQNFRRTTDSSGVIRFPNLIEDKELTGVNQVWVSDITYYELQGRWYYLTFIMDLYSRKVKGYAVSRRLTTEETTLPALSQAIDETSACWGVILHSDGGGQYYSRRFLELTKDHGIINSMGESVYENAHAERVNGTIKNQYLSHYSPRTYNELMKMLEKAVIMYNTFRPHQALNGLSPLQFEQQLGIYPQKSQLLTKKKAVKKKDYNSNNKPTKTVNSIQ